MHEVRVGRPQLLGTTRQGPVTSAIRKHPLPAGTIELQLDELNLAGDDQADRTVHGGIDKALLVVPRGHIDIYARYGIDAGVGIGENLRIDGADEEQVRIGDVLRWSGALVQVSQPRSPCYKLALLAGDKRVAATMIDLARPGWYLRVLRPGRVRVAEPLEPLELVERDDAAPTVAVAFKAMFPDRHGDVDDALATRVVEHPALASQWRDILQQRRFGRW